MVVDEHLQIPKCRKGRSVEDALIEFIGNHYSPPSRAIWAETKYDGYR
jgi:DNA ligase-4